MYIDPFLVGFIVGNATMLVALITIASFSVKGK